MSIKKTVLIVILPIFIFVLSGCMIQSIETDSSKDNDRVKDLKVIGDVLNVVNVKDFLNTEIDYERKQLEAVETSYLIDQIELVYDTNNLYLTTYDGFMNKLEGDSLKDTFIAYNDNNRWLFISEKHLSNNIIKDIETIIIVKDTKVVDYSFGLNIIDGKTNETFNYSIGELLTESYTCYPYSDDDFVKEKDSSKYSVDVLKQKKCVKIEDLINHEFSDYLIMNEEGNQRYSSKGKGMIELLDNYVNYIYPEDFKSYNYLKGIMINPPSSTVMDSYDFMKNSLKDGKKTLVIFIDGFSYNQYNYFLNEKKDYYITTMAKEVYKANTVYKPVTNAGFAAMITGVTPVESGILNRSYRELKVDTIFDYAKDLGLEACLIEGDIKILNTNIEPILNLDKNKNGITDDEIYEASKVCLQTNPDLTLIHFHSLDDCGHAYGPFGEKTIGEFELIDQYVEDLAKDFDGKVYITTDHGMHATTDGGSHGEFRSEDMIIPLIVIK